MNADTLTKNYGRLTAKERFSLVLAAGDRGDETEQDRLVSASGRITLRVPDYFPYARAFDTVSMATLVELLDAAADYLMALRLADDADHDDGAEGESGGDEAEAGDEGDVAEAEGADIGEAEAEAGAYTKPTWLRLLDVALARGYVLQAKAAGWERFCERLGVPPYALSKHLPGFDRLQRAVKLTEQAAFAPEGMLVWLNSIRPAGEEPVAELVVTPERCTEDLEAAFRELAAQWGV